MRFWLIILHQEQNGDRTRIAAVKPQPGRDILIGGSDSSLTRWCRMAPSGVPVQGPRHLGEEELAQIGVDLKRRTVSEIATSVGSRSMLEAPKNPTMPLVFSST